MATKCRRDLFLFGRCAYNIFLLWEANAFKQPRKRKFRIIIQKYVVCMMIVFMLMFRNSLNNKVQHYHLSSSLKHEDSSPETTTSLRAISWTTTSRWKTISSRGWAKPILRPRGLKQTEVPNRNCSVEQAERSTFTKGVPFENFERT